MDSFHQLCYPLSQCPEGSLLGITQAAVSKWEKKGREVANVELAIEFCLRVLALEQLEIS